MRCGKTGAVPQTMPGVWGIKMKIMSVFGTRPEAVKMCPLIKKMQEYKEIKSVVCLTGQHEEMLQQVIDIFQIHADYNLHIMKIGRAHV